MFEYWKFRWRLRKLHRQRDLMWRDARRATRAIGEALLEATNSVEELEDTAVQDVIKEPLQDIVRQSIEQMKAIDEAIGFLITNYYTNEAERLMLPLPSFDEKKNWKESARSPVFSHLTEEGLTQLRSAIRKEKKERWEQWQMRISLLIGVAGALMGLVALLKK